MNTIDQLKTRALRSDLFRIVNRLKPISAASAARWWRRQEKKAEAGPETKAFISGYVAVWKKLQDEVGVNNLEKILGTPHIEQRITLLAGIACADAALIERVLLKEAQGRAIRDIFAGWAKYRSKVLREDRMDGTNLYPTLWEMSLEKK